MVLFRSVLLSIAFFAGILLALPLKAQTSATLNVSARVVEECTVRSKRELFHLARKLNDPSIIRRCSKGVVSRVNHQIVKSANLHPPAAQAARVSSKRIHRLSATGGADVMLVTVTY